MEGFFVLLGILACVVVFILPICTYVAVSRLRERIESLESIVQGVATLMSKKAALGAESATAAKPAEPPAAVVPPAALSHPLPQAPLQASAPKPVAPAPVPAAPAPAAPPVVPRAVSARPPESPVDADTAAARLLRRAWNWIVVGEEFRKPGLSAEFAIATTWLIRAGVLVAVFAVGFGLQLSIARGLLGPAGRVSLALLCGAAFLVAGLRSMNKRYQMLGQGFLGGGLAMFYFAFYAAAVMFALVPVSVAFVCMAAVTAAAVVLAVRFEALSVAVLGAVGGYVTPLMLKSAHPNLPVLYAYLAVLALGMAGVAVRRQWPLLTWLSLIANTVLFLGAAGGRCRWCEGEGTVQEIVYLCAFFALYSSAVFAYAARNRVTSTPVEIVALFFNAAVTVGGGALLIGYGPERRMYLALLTLGLAAFYVAHIWFFLIRRASDRVLLSGFIALAVVLLGLSLPLLFTGNVLSAMFALQAVALLWIGRRLDSRMFTLGALCCYAVVLLRLAGGLLEGSAFPRGEPAVYWAGLRDRLTEFVVPILALFGGWRLFRTAPAAARQGVGDSGMRGPEAFRRAAVFFVSVFYVGLIAYVTCELFSLAAVFLPSARMAVVTVVWSLFALHLLLVRAHLSEGTFERLLKLAVALVAVQWFFGGWLFARAPVLDELRHAAAFSLSTACPRLVATAALVAVVLGARRSLEQGKEAAAGLRQMLLNAALVAGFLYLTFETATCCTAFVPGFRAGAVSVVWGCYGLGLLVGGLRFGQRALRMAGLALLSVTIGKVFMVDLSGLDVLYRLLAFGILGGVLLLAAYAYLRNQDTFTKTPEGGKGEA